MFLFGFIYRERLAKRIAVFKRFVLLFDIRLSSNIYRFDMEPACRKDKPKLNTTPTRGDRARQKSAQQELKQRQRAEIYALNKVMTELEQQQFEAFCKQMQSQGE
ncbi:small vasohibin-binding protein [Boleophthalmus pectinirostris]|uniref:small vasohibin-binding protein n=1 Tax=Boleophthalmus pectinirostris TaxID=150288 RepID=UPI002433060A|nr:small vasohibin-binding protein [Boleophthalmus pectinirostris]